jgi:uncharacterized lipoprotein YmbA
MRNTSITMMAACIAAALTLAGCGSAPTQRTEVLDDKGRGLFTNPHRQ